MKTCYIVDASTTNLKKQEAKKNYTMNNQQQILITLLSHEMLKSKNNLYDTPQSPVPNRSVHVGLEVGSSEMNLESVSIFIPTHLEYEEYIKLIRYAAQNPISEEVFNKAKVTSTMLN